jgi:hypothetical protein
VVLDDAMHDRQAKAGALAGHLGREKGIENTPLHVVGHAAAVVADGEPHIRAGTQVRVRSRKGFIHGHGVQADLDPALPAAQGMLGIGT